MKGFWHIVDAVMATVVIIGFLMVTTGTIIVVPEDSGFARVPYSLLRGLDEKGVLRNHTVSMNTQALENEISMFSYNHSVQICDSSNTCTGNVPSAKNVWIGTYFISGNNSFDPHTVKLYLWRSS